MMGTAGRGDRSRESGPVLLVDSHARGISIGRAQRGCGEYLLRWCAASEAPLPLRSRYVMHGADPRNDLARHLERLSVRGELREATVVFGVSSDPFHPFDEKFATSLRLLEIFERFVPGRLVIQTRSPLVVIALPALKRVRDATSVVIGIETPLEEVRRRYTPELPSIAERWKVVRTAKRFGFKVGVQVGPMLPYGDWRKDAQLFADELVEAADFITIQSLMQGEGGGRPRSSLARALAADRQFFWLRHDTHRPLTEAITQFAEAKLYHPLALPLPERQLPLFA